MANNVKINIKNNNIDFGLRLLKKKIKDYKIMLDYQNTLSFEKPSVKKRKKRLEARRRHRYELSQENIKY